MKEKSIKVNFIFNFLKTFCNIAFPVVTFSYAARILGAEGIGQVNFTKSIVSYFASFALLGMTYYGTREAAKIRDDKTQLSKFTHEILMINALSTFIAYVVLAICIACIGSLRGYTVLLLVQSAMIVLTGMGMEWLYSAVEEYKYISVRAILFQLISLVLMLLFVRTKDDVIAYAWITILASSGSYVLNFFYCRKVIDFKRQPRYQFKRHIKPILLLFAMALSIEFYTMLNSTMLGALQGDVSVGLYTAAEKMAKMVNRLITSLGIVLIPRLSYYIARDLSKKVEKLVFKAYRFVFIFSVPAAVGLFLVSNDINYLLSGAGFASAGLTMRILTPIIIIIPFSVVTNLQIFVPMQKETLILKSTIAGAAVNFVLNLLLIPKYAENGAAVATVVAETVVSLVCLHNLKSLFDVRMIFHGAYKYWIAVLPIVALYFLVYTFVHGYIIRIVLMVVVSVPLYIGLLFLLRDTEVIAIVKHAFDRFRRKTGHAKRRANAN